MELSGSTALVTGASSGIGRALALRLAEQGVRLAIGGRRGGTLEELADRIAAAGWSRPAVVAGDLAVRGAAEELVDRATDALGGVEILINNAGGAIGGRQAVVGDRDEGREVFELNVWAPLALIRRLVPGMVERGRGAVVNVTSMAQITTWPAMGHYTASKAALGSFTETLRLELKGSGVRVIEVIPGPVDTPIYGESQLVPGFTTATSAIRPGDPDVLARRMVRALRRDRARVVYPRPLRLAYAIPSVARTTVSIQAGRVASEMDREDDRILRAGSQGDALAQAARAAWERGDRKLAALKTAPPAGHDSTRQREGSRR